MTFNCQRDLSSLIGPDMKFKCVLTTIQLVRLVVTIRNCIATLSGSDTLSILALELICTTSCNRKRNLHFKSLFSRNLHLCFYFQELKKNQFRCSFWKMSWKKNSPDNILHVKTKLCNISTYPGRRHEKCCSWAKSTGSLYVHRTRAYTLVLGCAPRIYNLIIRYRQHLI